MCLWASPLLADSNIFKSYIFLEKLLSYAIIRDPLNFETANSIENKIFLILTSICTLSSVWLSEMLRAILYKCTSQ